MPKPCLGISENTFKRGEENIFKVCGTGLNPAGSDPKVAKVELVATKHTWTPNPATIIAKNPKWLCISSTPTKNPGPAVKTTSASMTDDLTVTVTFDDGSDVEITCDECEYVDP